MESKEVGLLDYRAGRSQVERRSGKGVQSESENMHQNKHSCLVQKKKKKQTNAKDVKKWSLKENGNVKRNEEQQKELIWG